MIQLFTDSFCSKHPKIRQLLHFLPVYCKKRAVYCKGLEAIINLLFIYIIKPILYHGDIVGSLRYKSIKMEKLNEKFFVMEEKEMRLIKGGVAPTNCMETTLTNTPGPNGQSCSDIMHEAYRDNTDNGETTPLGVKCTEVVCPDTPSGKNT